MVASAALNVYVASSHWEMLSLVGSTSYWIHVGAYITCFGDANRVVAFLNNRFVIKTDLTTSRETTRLDKKRQNGQDRNPPD